MTSSALTTDVAPAFLDLGSTPPPPQPVLDPLTEAVERQAAAARAAMQAVDRAIERAVDPSAWLFAERRRYLTEGTCDPYAEMMLRRAGFLTGA